MYSEEVMKHFRSPHNMGEIPDADGIGKVGNPICGDLMWVYIKVGKRGNEEYLEDVKVKTFGCVAAIATSSMITDLAKGKSLKEAEKITNNDIANALRGLPPVKLHCSVLSADGLHKAIEDYRGKKKNIALSGAEKKKFTDGKK